MLAEEDQAGERERLEGQLLASQALAERSLAELEAIYRLAPIGLCVNDTELRYVRINERLAAINGQSVAAHLGRTVREMVPALADTIEPLLKRVLETGEPLVEFELRGTVASRPGVERCWLTSYHPLRMPDGRIVGLNAAVLEITDRKRAQEELARSEQRFAAFMDNSPAAAYLKDEEGRYLYVNPAAAQVNGRPPAEWVGKTDADIFDAEEARALREHDLAVLASGGPMRLVEVVRTKGGRELLPYLSVKFRLEAGPQRLVGGISLDITEQKRAEREREALLEAERAARAEAEHANRIKDDFLATLSHELRTPLTAILGWSHMLQAGKVKPEAIPRALQVIARNAQAQSALVAELLDLSRIVSGKLTLAVQPVDVGVMVFGAAESAGQGAEQKGVQLEVTVEPSADCIQGDPARLGQVLSNLLTNATKFTPSGGKVTLSARRDGAVIEIAVVDTGEGIAPEFLPYVFDRFRQADASASRQHGGLGIGLAVSKQLVEMHGGEIRASSAGLGRGATFTVRLPASRTHAPLAESLPASWPTGPRLTGVRVLLVEDEADARELVLGWLSACGAGVSVAATAAEAMECFAREVPDVLVSDIGLPGEDGYALLDRVRALPVERGGRVPALALTAFARPEDRARAEQAGYQVHLAKPVGEEALCLSVANLLQGCKAPRQSRR